MNFFLLSSFTLLFIFIAMLDCNLAAVERSYQPYGKGDDEVDDDDDPSYTETTTKKAVKTTRSPESCSKNEEYGSLDCNKCRPSCENPWGKAKCSEKGCEKGCECRSGETRHPKTNKCILLAKCPNAKCPIVCGGGNGGCNNGGDDNSGDGGFDTSKGKSTCGGTVDAKGSWTKFGNAYYKAFTPTDKGLTHDEASRCCKSNDAELASVHSDEENKFIISLTQKITANHLFWLGLRTQPGRLKPAWTDDSELDYGAPPSTAGKHPYGPNAPSGCCCLWIWNAECDSPWPAKTWNIYVCELRGYGCLGTSGMVCKKTIGK